MMCERVLSRETQGTRLAEKQLVQAAIADSWTQILQLRLLVLYTAWLIDQKTTAGVRKEIAACKVECARVLHDVVQRAMHIHGALGVSNEMPLGGLWMLAPIMAIVDGPTEVHQVTIARQVLKDYRPSDGRFPSAWLPPRIDDARARFAAALEDHVGNL
jgi:acyl-CoA dehydrogenase